MGKIKVFPTPDYRSKQPSDPVVPKLPSTGILLGPSKSGKTVALKRIYIFSPSINVDDGWRPVKQYIEETMKVPTDREQVYFEDWDEAALRQIIRQQRKITETSKQLKMKQLYQKLILVDDFADSPHLHKRTDDTDSEGPDKAFRRDGFDAQRRAAAAAASDAWARRCCGDFGTISTPFRHRNLSIAPGIRDDHCGSRNFHKKVRTRSDKNPTRKILNNETFAHTQSSAQPPRHFQKT